MHLPLEVWNLVLSPFYRERLSMKIWGGSNERARFLKAFKSPQKLWNRQCVLSAFGAKGKARSLPLKYRGALWGSGLLTKGLSSSAQSRPWTRHAGRWESALHVPLSPLKRSTLDSNSDRVWPVQTETANWDGAIRSLNSTNTDVIQHKVPDHFTGSILCALSQPMFIHTM